MGFPELLYTLLREKAIVLPKDSSRVPNLVLMNKYSQN